MAVESLLTIGFTSQTTLFFFVLFFRRTQPAKDKWLFCDPGRKQKWHLNPKIWLLTLPFLKPDRICGRCCLVPFRRVSRFPPTFLLPRHLSFPDPGGDAYVRVSWDFLVWISDRCGSVSFEDALSSTPVAGATKASSGWGASTQTCLPWSPQITDRRSPQCWCWVWSVVFSLWFCVCCYSEYYHINYYINSCRFLRSFVWLAHVFLRPCAVAGGGRTVAGKDTHITIAQRSTAYPSTLPRAVLYLNLEVILHFTFIYCSVGFFLFVFFCLSSGLRGHVGVFSASCPNYKRSRWCQKWESHVLSGAGPSAWLGPVWLMNLEYYDIFFRSRTVDLWQPECIWLFIHFLLNELLWGGNGFDLEELEDTRSLCWII